MLSNDIFYDKICTNLSKSGYRKIETEEPEIDPEGDYTPTGKIRESE